MVADPTTTTTADRPVSDGDLQTSRGRGHWTSSRLAAVAFGAYLVVAFFLIVLHFGDDRWFAGDEWGFLVDRSLTDPGDLMRPQNSHWSAVPIVVYQLLFEIFGLHSYAPYLIAVAVLHLTLATLLRVTMRRAGVGPWFATCVAGVFVLFGTGHENILLGVQVSMVGSMVLGFAHMLLADHDGGIDRRDWLGLAAGVLALMSSGVGLVVVGLVGVAAFIRRGWKMALFHTAPLAALYILWWSLHRSVLEDQEYTYISVDTIFAWSRRGVSGVFLALAQNTVAAWLLGAIVVVGLVLRWIPFDWREFRRTASMPLACLITTIALFAVVSLQRAVVGETFITSSRYVSMGTAFSLPAIAVAIDSLGRRWRVVGVATLVPLFMGIPANIELLDKGGPPSGFYKSQQAYLLGAAYDPLIDEVDDDVRPDSARLGGAYADAQFLREARDAGKLPPAPPLVDDIKEQIETRLSLAQNYDNPAGLSCETYSKPLRLELTKDDTMLLASDIRVVRFGDGKKTAPTDYRMQFNGRALTVEVPELEIEVYPYPGKTSFTLCR